MSDECETTTSDINIRLSKEEMLSKLEAKTDRTEEEDKCIESLKGLIENEESEEVLKSKPTFEKWFDNGVAQREDCHMIRTNVIYYASISNLSFICAELREISKDTGKFKEESTEFKQLQKEWWYYYKKILLLRSFLVQYFNFPKPDWKKDLMPERYYCGVLMTEEDFMKFITTPMKRNDDNEKEE